MACLHGAQRARGDGGGQRAGGGLYPAQLAEAARLVAGELARAEGHERHWRLAYQSRSGPPSVPWLGPDIGDQLAELAARGAPAAVVIPAGFVSDHIEILFDLDTEAAQAGAPARPADGQGRHPRHPPPLRLHDHASW